MIDKFLRTAVEWPCWLLHRTWWIPIWNRSVWTSCLIVALTRYTWFSRWYHREGKQ